LTTIWPQATHISEDDSAPSVHQSNIVMSPYVLPNEIHNEHAHYSRLAIDFLLNNTLPLSFADPELEALLFPNLFPDGHGHYSDLYNQLSTNNDNVLTYGKYIKARLMGYDPRFRLHPVWTGPYHLIDNHFTDNHFTDKCSPTLFRNYPF
jgi:hypothetical protein